jgi:hypothetical protein
MTRTSRSPAEASGIGPGLIPRGPPLRHTETTRPSGTRTPCPRRIARAFTKYGALMAASVLSSATAVEMSIFVVRTRRRSRSGGSGSRATGRERRRVPFGEVVTPAGFESSADHSGETQARRGLAMDSGIFSDGSVPRVRAEQNEPASTAKNPAVVATTWQRKTGVENRCGGRRKTPASEFDRFLRSQIATSSYHRATHGRPEPRPA